MKTTFKKKLTITADFFPDNIRTEMDALMKREEKRKHIKQKWFLGTACCIIAIFIICSVISLPKVNAEAQVIQRVNEIKDVIKNDDVPAYIISAPVYCSHRLRHTWLKNKL